MDTVPQGGYLHQTMSTATPDTSIHTAPEGAEEPVLGRTLPSLLDEACELYPQDAALGGWRDDDADCRSTLSFRHDAECLALAMLNRGIERGDRVCMLMRNDVDFCLVDMACLIAGITNVPLYRNIQDSHLEFILDQTEAVALVLSDAGVSRRVAMMLSARPANLLIIGKRDVDLPEAIHNWDTPRTTLEHLIDEGRILHEKTPNRPTELKAMIQPRDIATIIYTSGTTGNPKGVVLAHESLAFSGCTGFNGIQELRAGTEERALSFLPMAHVFQRALYYAMIRAGIPIRFASPQDLLEAFARVRPTVFATVPRVLERIYGGIRAKGAELTGFKRWIFNASFRFACQLPLDRPAAGINAIRRAIFDRLVYSKWRAAAGGRLHVIVCGGAPLNATIARFFGAAGMLPLQGYGLTETSPIITYCRTPWNRGGTAGPPMAGVEVRLAVDGEILTRGPHIMLEYYRRPDATAEAIDADGFFHTGDIGTFDADGYLTLTDRKKNLFKLSTGRYVTPQPLESALNAEPLISACVVLGEGRRFCTAILFPEADRLLTWAKTKCLPDDLTVDQLLELPEVQNHIDSLVEAANKGLPSWSAIQHYRIINHELSVESGLLTPTMKVKRPAFLKKFKDTIAELYETSQI